MSLKSFLKDCIPPVLMRPLRKINASFTISGSYSSWEEAEKNSTGYDCDLVLQKVKRSLLKVKNNEAIAERDSVLLDEIPYSWPTLSVLLKESQNGKVCVVDFGGSLGNCYFYYKDWLKGIDLEWNIIEQKNFVDIGKSYFENEELKFFESVESIVECNIVLLNSVLQYLPNPWSILNDLLKLQAEYICIDRTLLSKNSIEKISIQKVSTAIYRASYPIRLIPEKKLIDFFSNDYDKIVGYKNVESESGYNCKGMIFRKKN